MQWLFINALWLLAVIIVTILIILGLVKFLLRNLPDEKLTLYLDFTKWIVVSVALVIIANVIDSSLKDREAGLKEISQYDKYVELVIANDKIGQRFRLAQYLSKVTASKTLRERWEVYFKDVIKKEYQDSLDKLNKEITSLDSLNKLKQSKGGNTASIDSLIEVQKEKVNILVDAFDPKIIIPKTTKSDNDDPSVWEEKGFEFLFQKNVAGAIDAFNNAEQSSNGYHMVYDIWNYLRRHRQELADETNNTAWKKAYTDILRNFSWRMPDDTKGKMKRLSIE